MDKQFKIFVSVGTRFPMDRLVEGVDKFVAKNPNYSCIAQIGASKQSYMHIETHNFLKEPEFKSLAQTADIHISHAGMGNILMAAELQKPIIIMPRKRLYKEHINNHQVDTAQAFSNKEFLHVVDEVSELSKAIKGLTFNDKQISDDEPLVRLNAAIGSFINT